MKTNLQTSGIPEGGVLVICEGLLTRLFFDFEAETVPQDGTAQDGTAQDMLYGCENVDVRSRSYGAIVSAIVNDRYGSDAVQAVLSNYEEARDADSGLAEEKRAEYLSEYAAFQSWRTHAKEVARKAVALLAGM